MPVSVTIPGAITLTRVRGAIDFAKDLAKACTAPLLAPYTGSAEPLCPAIEPRKMIWESGAKQCLTLWIVRN